MHGIYVVFEEKHEGSERPGYFKTLQEALQWNVRVKDHHKIPSFLGKIKDDHWRFVYEGDIFHVHYLYFFD